MTAPTDRRIPAWMWAALVVALGVVVGLLILGDRREDPPEAYRFDIDKFKQVEPEHLLFKEVAKLTPGIEKLSALAVGPDERIYVAGDKSVVVHGSNGKEAARHTLSGTPTCMAVAPDGNILLGMRDHIEELDAQGKPKKVWDTLGEKSHITSIAVKEDDVYVADAGQRVVLRFGRDGTSLGRIGEKNEAKEIPGFIIPSPNFDVAFDTHGALWAVNPGRHGLEQYRPNGDLVTSWYRPSMDVEGFCGCCNPSHVVFRSDGALITAEKGISRVKLYSPDWTYLGLVAAPSAFEGAVGDALSDDLETPIKDLAVDSAGRVLVLDARLGAVRIFEQTKRES